MPQGHKDGCMCPPCQKARKTAAQAVERTKNPVPAVEVEDTSAYKRLATDYEEALEQIKSLQGQATLAQSELDKAAVRLGETELILRRLRKERNIAMGWLATATDFLRSTSITHHRAEGHRGDYSKCEDVICRHAASAWYSIGEGAGVELAQKDADTWWEKKERNESIVASFADPVDLGELEPEDVEEALGYEDEAEEETPEPQGEVVEPSSLDELPDTAAFAGKKVRVLTPSTRDADDPGMPKRAKV